MNPQTGRRLTAIGLALQLAIVAGLIVALARLIVVFAKLGPGISIAEAANLVVAGAHQAILAIALALPFALTGLGLLFAAIKGGGVREPWVYRWGMRAMIPWLLILGLGTVIGIVGLIVLSKDRKTFAKHQNEPASS